MRARPRAFQIDPDHAMNTISLGVSMYQTYENKKTLKLLRRIHRYGFTQVLKQKKLVMPPINQKTPPRNENNV